MTKLGPLPLHFHLPDKTKTRIHIFWILDGVFKKILEVKNNSSEISGVTVPASHQDTVAWDKHLLLRCGFFSKNTQPQRCWQDLLSVFSWLQNRNRTPPDTPLAHSSVLQFLITATRITVSVRWADISHYVVQTYVSFALFNPKPSLQPSSSLSTIYTDKAVFTVSIIRPVVMVHIFSRWCKKVNVILSYLPELLEWTCKSHLTRLPLGIYKQ
jgi:hypothetical protein